MNLGKGEQALRRVIQVLVDRMPCSFECSLERAHFAVEVADRLIQFGCYDRTVFGRLEMFRLELIEVTRAVGASPCACRIIIFLRG
jgi:hypothetical protein